MNIILMTVLLTLLGAGLVVLLVWLSVVSWKSIKYRNESYNRFEDTDGRVDNIEVNFNKRVDTLNEYLNRRISEMYDYTDEFKREASSKFDEVYTTISKEFEELHRGIITDIFKNLEDNNERINRRFEELERNIDSRFDKFHNLLKQNTEKK